MTLEYDVCGALAGWLYRTGWVKWLLGEATISQQVYLVCERIGQRRLRGDRAQYLIRMSLVARYLIAYASIGARVNNISDVRERLINATGIGISLPYYWPLPPSDGKCELPAGQGWSCQAFFARLRVFRRVRNGYGVTLLAVQIDANQEILSRGLWTGLRASDTRRGVANADNSLRRRIAVQSSRNERGAFAHACLAAYVQQISRDHRPLGVGIQLLRVAEK